MEKDLDPEVIKTTQILLGKYVKRPQLTEKLLKKPPFRFLHDVITTVLKTTGFFENLFEEDELISENVKDRENKISFLNKVIFVLSSATGKSLSAKPSKIVAGQEAEKTNELLQCLAQALDNKLSSDKAVKQYKDSLKSARAPEVKNKELGKPVKKGNDTKKLSSRSNEKLTSQKNDIRSTIEQDKEKSNEAKSKRKENGPSKGESQTKKTQQSKTVIKKNTKDQKETDDITQQTRIKNTISTSNSIEKEKISSSLRTLHSQESDVSIEKDSTDDKLNVNQDESPRINSDDLEKPEALNFITEPDLNSIASSNDFIDTSHIHSTESKSIDNNSIKDVSPPDIYYQNQSNIDYSENVPVKNIEVDSNTSDKFKSTTTGLSKEPEDKRDTSSASVKVPVTNGNDVKTTRPSSVRPLSVRPSSSRPGAPRMREKVDNVIKDPDNLLIGKVNIIVENTHNEEEEDTSLIIMNHTETTVTSQDQQELQLSSSGHGHLVQQILDSQKELSQISGKTEIEWQFGALKAREAMKQDVEQLRFNIQALSRVANPLGKLLDHIQEDVEVMRQELLQWSNIYEDVNKEMQKQKTLNEDSLMPFNTKLKQLESDIEEKHDKINDLKILIHKNAMRIEKLLNNGSVQ